MNSRAFHKYYDKNYKRFSFLKRGYMYSFLYLWFINDLHSFSIFLVCLPEHQECEMSCTDGFVKTCLVHFIPCLISISRFRQNGKLEINCNLATIGIFFNYFPHVFLPFKWNLKWQECTDDTTPFVKQCRYDSAVLDR